MTSTPPRKRNSGKETYRWPWSWAVALALTAATLVAFGPVLGGEFLAWDDQYDVVNNRHIQSLGWDNLGWMFTTFHNGDYQPLCWLSLGLQHRLWGLRAAGFHAVSLVLHVANALLVFVVTRDLFRAWRAARQEAGEGSPGEQPRAGGVLGAAAAAALFAFHPLRVECVAWVSAQEHLQVAALALLSVWCYVRFATVGRRGGGRGFPLAALAWYAVSLLSKPAAIGLPLVLLALDVYPLRRWDRGRRGGLLLEKVPFLVLALAGAVVAHAARSAHSVVVPLEAFGVWPRLAQASFCLVFHLYKTLVPANLSPMYVMLDGFDPRAWRFVGSVFLVGAATLVCVGLRRRVPILWVVGVCYLAMLLPFLGLTDTPHFPADRYTYLSTLGFAAAAGAGLQACGRARRRGAALGRLLVPLVSLAVIVSVGLGFRSWRQTRLWKNTVVLAEHVLGQVGDYPKRSGLSAMLAQALAKNGRNQEAVARYREALEVNPQNRDAYLELGIVLARLGRWGECAAAYENAYRLDPDDWQVNFNLGTALVSLGEWERGLSHFERATRINPQDYRGYYNLANTLSRVGRYREAFAALEQGQQQAGEHLSLASRLAWLLATCPEEELRDGIRALQLADAINRRTGGVDPRALDSLAAAYAEVGRFDDAARTAGEALARCRRQGLGDLCDEIGARLELYGAGRPYREMPAEAEQR